MGALWAAGWSRDEIRLMAERFAPFHPFRTTYTRPGIFDLRYFRHYWSQYLPERFEDLAIPLIVVVTDVESGEPTYISSGPLEPAIAASCALPPLFEAVPLGDRLYFDGGLSMNLPTAPLRSRCKVVVASEVNPHRFSDPDRLRTTWGLYTRGLEVVFRSSSPKYRSLADVLVEPEGLEEIPPLDTSQYKKIEELGYEEATSIIEAGHPALERLDRASPESPIRLPKTRDAVVPEAGQPEVRAPVYPWLSGVRHFRENPGRALALLGVGAGAVGLLLWARGRQRRLL